jgi:hypothetical protein
VLEPLSSFTTHQSPSPFLHFRPRLLDFILVLCFADSGLLSIRRSTTTKIIYRIGVDGLGSWVGLEWAYSMLDRLRSMIELTSKDDIEYSNLRNFLDLGFGVQKPLRTSFHHRQFLCSPPIDKTAQQTTEVNKPKTTTTHLRLHFKIVTRITLSDFLLSSDSVVSRETTLPTPDG